MNIKQSIVALGHRDFRYFYSALVVAGLGSQVQSTANIWQIYELTHSAFYLGLTGLARAIPILALSLMGGVIADRVDRRRFIVYTQAVLGILSVLLAALTVTDLIRVWHIYAVTLLSSALTAISTPARSAIIPNIVPKQHLLNALALNSTIWQTSQILGPAVGGVCIAAFGLAATYFVNGLAHMFTLMALIAIRLGKVVVPSRQSPLKSLVEGFSFLRQESVIIVLLGMDSAAVFFGHFRVLLPIFAADLGVGARGLGFLLSASGVGALIGAGLVMSLGNVRYKGILVIIGILAYCGALVGLALSPWYPLALLFTGLLGSFDSLQAIPRNTVIQSITPDQLRGRVSSFQSMLTNGVPALGQAQVGAVAALIGASATLLVGAAACALVIVAMALSRRDLLAPHLGAEEAKPVAARTPEPQAAAIGKS